MIFATPMAVTVAAEDLRGVEQRIAARLTAAYGTDTTIEVVAGGARGATKNALIARAQANQQRNPFYLNARAMQLVKTAVPALYSAGAAARRTAEAIGNMMLVSIGENVGAQRNAGGSPFRALAPGYARRKAAAVGFIRPILRRTGDFLGGLHVRVTRGGGA